MKPKKKKRLLKILKNIQNEQLYHQWNSKSIFLSLPINWVDINERKQFLLDLMLSSMINNKECKVEALEKALHHDD